MGDMTLDASKTKFPPAGHRKLSSGSKSTHSDAESKGGGDVEIHDEDGDFVGFGEQHEYETDDMESKSKFSITKVSA